MDFLWNTVRNTVKSQMPYLMHFLHYSLWVNPSQRP